MRTHLTLPDIAFSIACVCIAVSAFQHSDIAETAHVADRHAAKGSQIQVSGLDFGADRQTLVLVFNTKCVYCNRSTAFYRRIGASSGRVVGDFRFVVLSAESETKLQSHLDSHGIAVDSVVVVDRTELPSELTPTLILVDREGIVRERWIGLQSPAGEETVLRAVEEGA